MMFRRARKLLKSRLQHYPTAFPLYAGASWAARGTKRLLPKLVESFFPMWIGPRVRLAEQYFRDEPEKAIAIIDDVLARKPHVCADDRMFHRIASLYYLDGRYEDARRLFEDTEKHRRELARELQYDQLGLRFFSKDFHNIGPLGYLDKYIKADILGVIPHRTNVILGAPEHFSNPAYVRYWEKYFSLVTHPLTISLLASPSYCLEERSHRLWCGGSLAAIARETQTKWEAEGRSPLLELTPEHRERGYRRLREFGVPEGAWFAGLHVRDETDRINMRNADIATYRLAIEEIANRGGWVLRMGDANMRPLPSWPNTVDYAHSDKREDWMDVFLWAEGRFFIGTASGPQLIPTTFGKPVAIANYGPISGIVCGRDDILLPQHYWHERKGQYLTFAERMSAPYAHQESLKAFAKLGIRIIANTEEELRELVIEMMDRLEGRHKETAEEIALQRRFADMAALHELYPVKLARALLARHSDQLRAGTARRSTAEPTPSSVS